MASSSSQNTHEDISSTFDEEEIPIPTNLLFTLESLKLLIHNPLTPNNYLTWSKQVESTLLANNYTKYINPTTPTPPPFILSQEGQSSPNPLYPKYNLINQSLLTALIATISPPLQPLTLRLNTAADLWSTIKDHLQPQTRSRMLQLKAELHTLSMRGTDLTQYLTRVRSLHDQLEAAGCHTDDEDMILLILNGLPEQFNGFISAFRLQPGRITLPNFYSLLTTEATNLQHRSKLLSPDPHLAPTTTHHQPPPTQQRNPNYKGKNPRPYNPPSPTSQTHRFRHHPPPPSTSPSHPKTAYHSHHHPNPTISHPPTPSWLLDSGASAHLTNQFQNLHIPHPYTGHDSVSVGNGTQLPITHTGHHTIITPNRKFHLPELLYVPTLKHNLLSVFHLTSQNNCSITFDSHGFSIRDNTTNHILHQGTVTNGLYPLTSSSISSYSATTSPTDWHARLGHPHMDVIHHLSKNTDCISHSRTPSSCNACGVSKSHKLSFISSSIKTSTPFQLVHSDIWGPSPHVSHQNFRYFILFIDDYSRYTWLFPLHSKSQSLQTFQHFHKMVQTQFNLPIKALRSDHGGEFISTAFSTYLLQHGIHHQFSCPHTPEQNGVAERKNRHLLETARTLLHHASLPPPFWLEATSTATYLINRLPTKTLNMISPYQKLHHQPPSYLHLKTFGCLCYPWTAYTRTNKLDPKSSPCIFIGYSSDHKGFRCFDPQTSKLIISRHVRFHEYEFPMATHLITPTIPHISTVHNPLPLLPTPTFYTPPTQSINPTTRPITPPPPPPTRTTDTHIQYQRRRPPTTKHPSLPLPPLLPSPDPTPTPPPTTQPTSTHPMTTRSKSITPTTSLNLSLTTTDPTNYNQASSNPHWQQAMSIEIQALLQQNTWQLVPKPPNRPILGSKWTYKTKLNPDGSIARYKARLVAQGYRQTHGIDYLETFSPVAKIPTIRLFFIVAFHHKWPLSQIDVSNAFLHGTLKEEVYMHQPKGFLSITHPTHVCLLKKTIYGLKQSSREWNAALTSHLTRHGFHSSTADPSLFILHTTTTQLYLLIYVDDLLITGNNPQAITSIITSLGQAFNIRHLGNPQVFLGIHTSLTPTGFFLHQQPYATSIIHLAGLDSSSPVSTPLPSRDTTSTSTSKPFPNPELYRRIAGSLQYLVITRPDIAHAVNQTCQHMHAPQDHHFSLLTRILRYIKGTLHYGIPITPGHLHLTAYTDSDWAGNPADRTSTTGFCIFLGPNLLHWKSQKQKTVARSSSEAEYRALSSTITELIWIRRLLHEFNIPQESPTLLLCDNTSAIAMAKNPILKARTKHVEIDHHFIREHIHNGSIDLQHISTKDQIADIFTKRLPKRQFNFLCNKLTIQHKDH